MDCFQVYPMLLLLLMLDWCSCNHFVRNSASILPPTLCSNHAKGPTSGFSPISSNQPHGFHGFGRVPTKFSYSFAEVFIGSLPLKKVDSRQSSKACQTQVITSPSMGLGLANCCAGISRGDIPTIDLGPGRLVRLIHRKSSDLCPPVVSSKKASHGSQERLAEEAFQFAAWLLLSESYGILVSRDPFPRTQSELL